jgi:site-specific recombinase XerD
MAKANNSKSTRLGRQARSMAGKHQGSTNRSFGSQTGLKNSGNMERLGSWLNNHGLNSLDNLKTKHLIAFFNEKITDGVVKSTLEGYITAAKRLCQAVGKEKVFENLKSDKELMQKVTRFKEDREKPVDANMDKIQELTDKHYARNEWQGLAHELQRAFGLREKESLLSCGTKEKGNILCLVIRGTKGNRPRGIAIRTREQLDLVLRVQKYIENTTGKSLVPTEMSLKQAVKRMSNDTYRMGGTKENKANMHAARHRYTKTRIAEGASHRDIAEELGHGREYVVRHYAEIGAE